MKKLIFISIIVIIIIVSAFVLIKIFPKNKENSGYLAINTDKTEYLPEETVKILITAVDENGKVDCDSNLELSINGVNAKSIAKSSTCYDEITNNPDYFFNFKPEKIGKYELKLTNYDTKVSTLNSFDVVEERNLDISREAAIRINPLKKDRYPMKLIVTARKDFSGEISDLIPNGFTIPWQGQAKVEGNKISWQIDLNAGETKELIYEYKPTTNIYGIYKFGNNNEWHVVVLN